VETREEEEEEEEIHVSSHGLLGCDAEWKRFREPF
jgi:hypothetical protein